MVEKTAIYKKLNSLQKALKSGELFQLVWENRSVQEKIVTLNTRDQLFYEGVDSDGIKLGQYSSYTIALKKQKNLEFRFINLNETGAFYESFSVLAKKTGFAIRANAIKKDGKKTTDLTKKYGSEIIGLTKQSKAVLTKFIAPKIKKEIFRLY